MSETAEDLSPSLRDTIAAAYDAAEAGPDAPAPARDEAGRFAPKPDAPAEAAPPPEDDYDEAVGLDREVWGQTPAQARERAKALARERAELEGRVRAWEPLDGVFAPHRDTIRRQYGDEANFARTMLELSEWSHRDFPGFVRELAKSRGVDLASVLGGGGGAPAPGAPAAPEPPDIRAVARAEAERLIAEREAQSDFQKFAANPEHEFRDDPAVRRIMAGLISTGAAADYAAAYQMAVKAHPDTAAKLAERDAKRRAEEAAREAGAKRQAAASVRGAPGTTRAAPPAGNPNASLRGTIEAEYDRLYGAV